MVIGISGKMGSGKDTVGQIIHQLVSDHKDSSHNTSVDYSQLHNCWETKKFADKLKDITCMLIGCSREQLEDREYKERELGEDWWLYTDGFTNEPFIGGNCKNLVQYNTRVEKLTPRKILQLLGTEAGREIIHPNIWVNSLMSEYRGSVDTRANIPDWESKWIITDMRFPNELDAVKAKKGITIRVNRPDTDHLSGSHASETALDESKFDYTIENNSTIKDLFENVKLILEIEGIS